MQIRIPVILLLPLLTCRPSLPAIAETPPVSIRIDTAKPLGELNHKVFGQLIPGADNYGIFSIPHHDLAVMHEGDGIWNPATRAPYAATWSILQSYRPGSLRYPDGLGVHNHDWKKTIGPLSERGDWKFGLDEFMSIAERLGAAPLFVVSEYIGAPQDAADLVEYLNKPAEPRYPWAMKRAANGRSAPWNVKYFELGNESWVDWRKIGKTQVRPPKAVAEYASALARAMKAVDSSIQCGIPYGNDRWNKDVLPHISRDIDFFIVHSYPVQYGGGDLDGPNENLLLEAMMAGGYKAGFDLAGHHAKVREYTGRDMPVMVTEYNTGPTQEISGLKRPYRFTLASALGTGDFMGRMLDPALNVEAASYWSWINGFFGAVSTYAKNSWYSLEKRNPPELRPTHHVLELWGQYRGDRLLSARVDTPRLEFPGFTTTRPFVGTELAEPARIAKTNLLNGAQIFKNSTKNIRITPPDGGIIDGEWIFNYDGFARKSAYPDLLARSLNTLPAGQRPPTVGVNYEFSFDALWEPAPGSSAPNLGMQIADARGWEASGSASVIRGVEAAAGKWTHFSVMYMPLADTRSVQVLNRIEAGTEPVTGTLRIRNLRAEPWRGKTFPARPALTAYASASADGKKVFLVVFNLTLDRDLPATLTWDAATFPATAATCSEVNAPAAVSGKDAVRRVADNVPLPLAAPGELRHVFPAHSATGIVIEQKR
ncbi:alpha-L-arabinofuranosidase [Opitutaceae bacterium TAV1]|nr:alpha-L-arabinofuranosidase [Opitutaceae bacterium TAV1]